MLSIDDVKKLGKSNDEIILIDKSLYFKNTFIEKFENDITGLLSDIKKSFIYKEEKYSGVCIYSFEREAQNSAVNISTGETVN